MFAQEIRILEAPAVPRKPFRVSWAYPNTYAVGMSGLGYQLIWYLLESQGVDPFRVFTDIQQPGWQEAELLGFTLSWELDYANIITLLNAAGVPGDTLLRADDCPLVFGGGPVLAANPEPFAHLFDVILLGDAEVLVPELITAWSELRGAGSRQEKLQALACFPGLYVPSLYEVEYNPDTSAISAIRPKVPAAPEFVPRQIFKAPPDYAAHSIVLAPGGSWGEMFLLEVVRSCPQECRFCLASYLTRPFRFASVDTLMQKVEMACRHTPKIGLLGPSVTEHPQFPEFAERLLARGNLDISVASIRMDTVESSILRMLVGLGQRSVTVAIESGSERLRAIMKKNLSQEQIYTGMGAIAESGLAGVKLYGIAGLPGETDEDLDETIVLLTGLKKAFRHLRITFGLSSFVPKAQTPFQWAARPRDCGQKMEYLRKHLAKVGIEVRPESHNWSDIQALISRGDRRLQPLLEIVHSQSGNLGAWRKNLRQVSDAVPPPMNFYVHRDIPLDEVLPWHHLTNQDRQDYLQRHQALAMELAR